MVIVSVTVFIICSIFVLAFFGYTHDRIRSLENRVTILEEVIMRGKTK